MLNTVLADAVSLTLCWRSFGATLLETQSLEFASWNQELHSFASKRTLVHLAANGSNEPTLINAAIPTNGGFSIAAYVDSIDLRQRISQRYRRWFPAAEHASGMKREYGKEELLSAETVTAPATVSGE